MKNPNRMLAILLALALCLSCLVGPVTAADGTSDACSVPEAPAEQASFRTAAAPAGGLIAGDPVRVLVLLEGDPAAGSFPALRSAVQTKLAAQRAALRKSLAQAGVPCTLHGEYDVLLNAVALTLPAGALETLAAQPGVRAVCADERFDPPETVLMDSVNDMTGGTWMHDSGWTGSGTVIAVLDTGVNTAHEAFAVRDGMPAQPKLTRQAAEDAAAALGRGVWLSEKIPFAWDYYDGDGDVTDASGHGTHVAGVAAGCALTDDGAVKFCGSAPDAQLLILKIFPSEPADGATYASVWLRALEDAYLLGADVINLSVGSPSGFSADQSLQSGVLDDVLQTLRAQGVAVVCAAGNDGSMAANASTQAGPGYVTGDYADYGVLSTPASLDGCIAVAAAANNYRYVRSIRVAERVIPFTDVGGRFLEAFAGQADLEYAVIPNDGRAEDYAGLMAEGRVALVSRGGISFQEKLDCAAEAGAVGILISNNVPGELTLSLSDPRIPAAAVSMEDGAWLVEQAVTRDPAAAPQGDDSGEDLTGVYQRVTQGSELTPGSYLIVSETASAAFNAGLSGAALHQPNNFLPVTVRNRTIPVTAALRGAELQYAGSLLSNDDRFLVCTGPEDLVDMADSPEDLSVAVGTDGTAQIISRGAALRFDPNLPAFRFSRPADGLCDEPAAAVTFYKWSSAPALRPTDIGALTVDPEVVRIESGDGGSLAAYSSMGVTPDLQLKPSLTGVGSYVRSAAAGGAEAYESLSGTSMAAPNAAGALACLLQYLAQTQPDLGPQARMELAEDLLESSAALRSDADGRLFSPRKQGAGLIDLEAAAAARVVLRDPILSLGDSTAGVFTLNFTAQNLTDELLTCSVEVTALRDAAAESEGASGRSYNSLRTLDVSEEVELQGDTVLTLPAGAQVQATLTLTVGESLREAILADFPNGGYLDGVLSLYELEPTCDGQEGCPGYHLTDMPSNWAHAGIDFVLRRGLFSGTTPTTFSPWRTMNRGMMVTVLYALAGRPEPTGENPFRDVKENAYYTNAVIWAAENDIVGGVTADTFCPLADITREQIVAILFKYAKRIHADSDDRARLEDYPDADAVHNYAVEAMRWGVAAGILSGVRETDGKVYLRPRANATRAQVATIFRSFVNRCVELPVPAAHAVFTGFVGDWAQAPILETADWRALVDADNGLTEERPEVNTACSLAWLTDASDPEPAFGGWPGDNPYGLVPYSEARAVLSPQGARSAVALRPMLLRNARRLILTVTDAETGTLYASEALEYRSKARWDSAGGGWSSGVGFRYSGTDAAGEPLSGGTAVDVRVYAELDWGEDGLGAIPLEALAEQGGDYLAWSFRLTVDDAPPVLRDLRYNPAARTLTFTVQDDQFAAFGELMPTRFVSAANDEIPITGPVWTEVWGGETPGEARTVTVSGVLPGEYLLRLADYAANETTVALSLGSAAPLHRVDFLCPAGCGTDLADAYYAAEGAELTLPGLVGDPAEGVFFGWFPEPLTQVWSLEALQEAAMDEEIRRPGERTEIYADSIFYTLCTVPLAFEADPELLYEYKQPLPACGGIWAFAGEPIAEGSCGTPFLTADGAASLSETGVDEETGEAVLLDSSEDLRFTLSLAGEGYTVRSSVGRYLTVADGALSFAAGSEAAAIWQLCFDPETASYAVQTVDGWLLAFDPEAAAFRVIPPDAQPSAPQRLRLFGGRITGYGYITAGE